jgi:hypothetical protein
MTVHAAGRNDGMDPHVQSCVMSGISRGLARSGRDFSFSDLFSKQQQRKDVVPPLLHGHGRRISDRVECGVDKEGAAKEKKRTAHPHPTIEM